MNHRVSPPRTVMFVRCQVMTALQVEQSEEGGKHLLGAGLPSAQCYFKVEILVQNTDH